MSAKDPEITVNTHYPTGGANVTVSVWLTEAERHNLIERITAHETLVHDREKLIEGLQLAPNNTPNTDQSEDRTVAERFTWEVSMLE